MKILLVTRPGWLLGKRHTNCFDRLAEWYKGIMASNRLTIKQDSKRSSLTSIEYFGDDWQPKNTRYSINDTEHHDHCNWCIDNYSLFRSQSLFTFSPRIKVFRQWSSDTMIVTHEDLARKIALQRWLMKLLKMLILLMWAHSCDPDPDTDSNPDLDPDFDPDLDPDVDPLTLSLTPTLTLMLTLTMTLNLSLSLELLRHVFLECLPQKDLSMSSSWPHCWHCPFCSLWHWHFSCFLALTILKVKFSLKLKHSYWHNHMGIKATNTTHENIKTH